MPKSARNHRRCALFRREACHTPCTDYPRVGPSKCTKWFRPSITPGPIYASWTASQPCRIDAGGNIFVGSDSNISHKGNTAVAATCARGRGSSAERNGEQPSCCANTRQGDLCCNNMSHADDMGGHRPKTTDGSGRGSSVLHHVGGVLRCRSAAANLRRPATGGCRGGSDAIVAPTIPTLRAYSSPLVLHSTSFPPKQSHQTAAGKAGSPGANGSRQGGAPKLRGGRKNEGKEGEAVVAVAGVAPGRHRQGGYLHRYMGFEQDKLWFPPVTTFTVLGGLREFPRNGAPAAVRQTLNGETLVRVEPEAKEPASKPGGSDSSGSTARLFEGRRSLVDGPSEVVAIHDEVCPLELFADGSNLAPVSPPDGGRVSPVWCSRSKGRPRGAKRLKSWEASARRASPENVVNKAARSVTAKTRGRYFLQSGTASSPNTGAFLPYSLERPVSPLRTDAFSYTCN